MKSITITAAMNRLLTCLAWGVDFEIKPNNLVTQILQDHDVIPYPIPNLNNGMNIVPEYDPVTETRDMKIGLLMIGRGGHGMQVDEDGEISPSTYPHKATHTGMFQPIPFIARLIDNDLTEEEREIYRLRVTGERDNQTYVFYFGRKLPELTEGIIEVLETVEDGKVVNSIPYEATVNDLKPIHEDLSTDSEGIYLRTYIPTQVDFTPEQIDEIKYACEIIYGTENKAVISELAFCFGIDKPITQRYTNDGVGLTAVTDGSREYTACHIGIMESTFKPIIFTGGFTDTKNVGISEPLYGGR